MALQPLIAVDTDLLKSFNESAQALAQILQQVQTASAGLSSGNAIAEGLSASAGTATSNATTAAQTTAGTTETSAGNVNAGTSDTPSAAGTQQQAEAGAAASNAGTSTSGDAATGNAGASSEQATANAGNSSAEAPAVTYDDVTKATLALAGAKGRDAAVKVLGTFGVDHGNKLTPEQWAPYIAAANAALQPELA